MLLNFSTWRSGLVSLSITAFLATPAAAQQASASTDELPDVLVAPSGTVLTVQIDDSLSSSRNSVGDSFFGSLKQPLVIDGWVVARPGQTVSGQVVSANKAGRTRGTADLALELTEIVLVDGQQVPIQTQLVVNRGRESHEQDAATIAGATAVGSIIGAAIGQGKGAAIGAGVGAAAGTAGVLSTRGKAAEISPETTLTFRLDSPLAISTAKTPRAFQMVAPEDYDKEPELRSPAESRPAVYRDSEPDYDRYPRFPDRRHD
jgi:hypothetical protein